MAAYVHQKGNGQLLTQGLYDGTNQERAEQSLSHGTHSIDSVPFGGKNDILTF